MTHIQDKDSKNNGRWTKIQHQRFLLGLQLYGKNWKKIQQLVNTRSGAQIRSHAQKFFLKSNTPCELQQQQEGTVESQQLQKSLSVISNYISEIEENNSQYSYFFNKILKSTLNKHNFSFWESFIDIGSSKSQKIQIEPIQDIKRKDSFVIFDTCNDSKQETALSGLSILGEPIIQNFNS